MLMQEHFSLIMLCICMQMGLNFACLFDELGFHAIAVARSE